MKTYFTVIPALFNEDGSTIQDFNKMTPLAIVAMNHLGIHVYKVKGKGWATDVWDNAFTEVREFLTEAAETLPDYSPAFTPPCSTNVRESVSETAMIGRFFHDMKLLGLNTLHSWNMEFVIDCMDYSCVQKNVELQGMMEATESSYFLGREGKLTALNSFSSTRDRHIPTSGNILFSDDVTKIGFPLMGGMKGGMAVTSVYRSITGHEHYPYQRGEAGNEGRGIEYIRKLHIDNPSSFIAEEITVLYQNAALNAIHAERYPANS
jgi:hypothetical protein